METKAKAPDSRVSRVYVCQASYASCVPQSAKQFWTAATSLYRGRCYFTAAGGSLLANCFNQFWVHALNLQEIYQEGDKARRGGRSLKDNPFPKVNDNLYGDMWEEGWKGSGNFTHFAMLHDDIVPVDNWLDTLLEDLLTYNADVVSAVVPIKDGHGLTSTAIDSPDSIFDIERRLTMAEVMRLPEVFGAVDCGYPTRRLLLNSGCWVADFTKPWRHNVRFTIQDRIIREPRTNRWQAQVSSEDWQFSRDVQDQGGKVFATRRVHLTHFGGLPFANYSAWGDWDHDKVSASKFGGRSIGSRPDENKRPFEWHESQELTEFRSERYSDVPGWLTDAEGEYLAKLADNKRVLEIGSFCGRSTIWLGTTAREVHAIDTWKGTSTPAVGHDMFEHFINNITRYGVSGKITAHRGRAAEVIDKVPGYFDMVFIDGSHDYPAVVKDIQLSLKVLNPGGMLVFHDYNRLADPGVSKAVREFFKVKDEADVGSVLAVIPDKQKH